MANSNIPISLETTQTLDTMLHQILNQALVAVDADAGSLMLVANKQGILQIKARLGKPRAGRKTEAVYKIDERSVAGWVVQNRRSYLCNDIDNDPYFFPSRSGKNFLSLLSVPIIHEAKALAVINADAADKDHFTEMHREILESIASQVAGPIAERVSLLDALAAAGVELTRLPREGGVEPVLEKIADLAARSLGADVVTLYQYVQEKDEFPVEGTGPTTGGGLHDKSPMRRKVYPGDVPWVAVKERKSGFYSDVRVHEFLTGEVDRPGDTPRPRFVDREGIKSMATLLLPFRAAEDPDEEVVGVMFANYRSHHDFNIDEISALATFADYAAMAILNVRHEEQRRAEQMRMVEAISANFAHRMSNLAGTSRVATQMLRRINPDLDALSLRQLDRIEHESKVLLELAERLARPFKMTGRMFDLAPLDIRNLVEDEINNLNLSPDRTEITKDCAGNLPLVNSVEFQLRQVLHDILNNAVEATETRDQRKLIVRIRPNEKAHRVEVEISDNGPGIPSDIRERLFAPGVTTKEGKLGIGLWWCRAFIQATGGDLLLKETRPGEGSTFLLEIPSSGQENLARSKERPQQDILIVDDESRWRETLLDALLSESSRYQVDIASSYSQASHKLATTDFKLAVIDVRLVDADDKNEDGLRLLSDLDRGDRKTKVILITAYPTEHQERVARQSPRLVQFVNKRKFIVSEFLDLVHSVVRQ